MNSSTSPAGFGDNHFGAEFMKLVPQFFQLKMTLDICGVVVSPVWTLYDVTVGSLRSAGGSDVGAVCWRHRIATDVIWTLAYSLCNRVNSLTVM